jgi:hypothetical protein
MLPPGTGIPHPATASNGALSGQLRRRDVVDHVARGLRRELVVDVEVLAVDLVKFSDSDSEGRSPPELTL